MPKLALKDRLWNYCQNQVKTLKEKRKASDLPDAQYNELCGEIRAYNDILDYLLKDALSKPL